LNWGGRSWTLKVDDVDPGVRWEGEKAGARVLALDGLSEAGRFHTGALTGATLVCFERHHERVEATYAPPGWGGLVVRAAWGPGPAHHALDLEVQVSATSVGELRNLEAGVTSRWAWRGEESSTAPTIWVEPRDARSAALSYDGREPERVLLSLTTLPMREMGRPFLRPRIFAPGLETAGEFYIEMAQPNDVARRIIGGPAPRGVASERTSFTRYALFGHDLEKGVVLRARLRGVWVVSTDPQAGALSLYQQFLAEAPPLGP
jgi:hypothetical protein